MKSIWVILLSVWSFAGIAFEEFLNLDKYFFYHKTNTIYTLEINTQVQDLNAVLHLRVFQKNGKYTVLYLDGPMAGSVVLFDGRELYIKLKDSDSPKLFEQIYDRTFTKPLAAFFAINIKKDYSLNAKGDLIAKYNKLLFQEIKMKVNSKGEPTDLDLFGKEGKLMSVKTSFADDLRLRGRFTFAENKFVTYELKVTDIYSRTLPSKLFDVKYINQAFLTTTSL